MVPRTTHCPTSLLELDQTNVYPNSSSKEMVDVAAASVGLGGFAKAFIGACSQEQGSLILQD